MSNSNTPQTPLSTSDEEAGIWCARFAEGDLDAHEHSAFEIWLNGDPDNRRRFEKALTYWNELDEVSGIPELVIHRQKALSSYRTAQKMRWGVGKRHVWFWATGAIAASLAAATIWYTAQPTQYRTGLGDRQVVTLKDGSQIALDADTLLKVKYGYASRKINLLKGRASFTVAHDKTRPFSVTTGHEVVVATGTAFSVERLNKQYRVVLYDGHVRVLQTADGTPKAQIVLTPDGKAHRAEDLLIPGSQLIVSSDPEAPVVMVGQVTPITEASPRAWESGQLDFDDEELSVAAERVNRYSRDVKIAVAPSAASIRISGTFNAGDVNAFASAVSGAFPVRQVHLGNQIALIKK